MAAFLFFPALALGLKPIVLYQDLVAGEGEAGFEDGPFYSAQFNTPMGLALNADGSILYVADQRNNRIRAVLLDEDNAVITLAGTGEAGQKDGPANQATFNQPIGLALLPDGLLAVNDRGNNLIRTIDLKSGKVSTLAGNGKEGRADGPALQAGLRGIWSMAYFPRDHSLYFSQPDDGLLRRINLDLGKVETIFENNTLVPHPAALCVANGRLYAADHDLPTVYQLKPVEGAKAPASVSKSSTPDPSPTPAAPSLLPQSVGEADHTVALAGLDDFLYAYQTGGSSPIQRLFPNPEPITFVSALAQGDDLINDPRNLLPHFRGGASAGPVGFAPDPRSLKRFFVSSPACQLVASFRDIGLYDLNRSYTQNAAGIGDYDYPLTKPKGTYRIMVLGRSYVSFVIKSKNFPMDGNEKVPVAKQLEIALNTMGALDDVPLHYEVFSMGPIQQHQLTVWPYYVAPPIAQKYDADMVIIMMDPGAGMGSYYLGPLTKEGIPPYVPDPEFMSKPESEKFKSGPMHDLFSLCQKKNILEVGPDGKWKNSPSLNDMAADPEIREKLIQILGKPLELLNQKLQSEKTAEGNPRKLVFCFFATADIFSGFDRPTKTKRLFWKQLCREKGIPFLDLTDDFTALRLTFYPFSEESGMDHFDGNGQRLFSEILSHELIKQRIIPFEPAKPVLDSR